MTPPNPLPRDGTATTTVASLKFEYRHDALGIGAARPRLSWTVVTSLAGWYQAAYAVEAYEADGSLREWTDRIESDQSVLVPWPFAPLMSRESRMVRVQVWDAEGRSSGWSESYPVEAGLLHADDWVARFVTPAWEEDTTRPQPSPLLRREFDARAPIAWARLYVTALGVYEIQLNGSVVGDHVLAPGWTSYDHRLRYQTFNVTDLLREGPNAIGAILGDGWYRGRLGFHGGRRNIYGDRLALLAQLEIGYTDGTLDRLVTNGVWRAATGPILASDLYDGEIYDARRERAGWSEPGHDASDWAGVRLIDRDLATLVAPLGPPVRRTEHLAPIAITTSPAGRTLVDFGQNLVGRLRLTVSGQAGETVTLRHAEVLEDGELCVRPLRFAQATDQYTLRGGPKETWEPRFTFHGFRYAEVSGWPGELGPDDIRAVVCHSDLDRTGWFECSDPQVNRLHENVVWSMRGNFLDVPTDCPQRDERLGWTGDIQVFAPTAAFLYDSMGFLASWLADLAVEQSPAGVVPYIVPNVRDGALPPTAAWGDAAVIVPWTLYQRYGDSRILADQFASMRAWVDCIANLAGARRLWDRGFQFGDWLDPAAPPARPGDTRTDPHLVATAYFARSAELLGLAAGVLNRAKEEDHYRTLATEAREAFDREYISPSGRIVSDSTTAYALALRFDLLRDSERRRHAGKRLADLVRDGGYRISTGFVGTPLICDALCDVGEYDTAFRLLTQRACPSWLYPVTMSATTIWERWDSMLPDGSVNPGEMTSFNHYALGAVADWLHRTVGGLAPAEPGYRHIEVKPHPGGRLAHARARHRTPYGPAEVAWAIERGHIGITVDVPPNTTATVTLPMTDADPITIGSGTHHWSYPISPAVRQPLSLDSPLIELIDDPDAWDAVVRAVPQLAGREVGLHGRRDMPLRQVVAVLPQSEALLAAVEGALNGLE
ncbi:MAG TPA: glycoside hydrolase family 78 protein [Chloroflexota bacterium]